jgi:ABC-type multidrug transport system ATPase subunit
LRKSFDANKTEVLKGVDLKIKKNSIFCLLGHNGSGKTTMMNILLGFLDSSSGVIVKPSEESISYCP